MEGSAERLGSGSFVRKSFDGDRVAAVGLTERGLLVGSAVYGVVGIALGAAEQTESDSRDASVFGCTEKTRSVAFIVTCPST